MTPTYHHVDRSRDFEPTDNYVALRDTCPVHHEVDHDPPFFVLTRFDDIVDALRRPDRFRNRDGPGVFFQDRGVLGSADDPDHARHRRVLRSSFAPRVIGRLEGRLRCITDELLDRFAPAGRGDFVEGVATPLPALAIAELLGIHEHDRAEFGRLSTESVAALTGGDVDRYRAARAELEGYVGAGLDERDALAEPERPDDVLTRLADGRRDGTLTDAEARHIGFQLLVAGHETTTSLLGMMMYRLLERPELMGALRADRTLIPTAIEEGLRFDSPVHGLFRTTAEATSVAGTDIPAGAKVQMLYASANRDPDRFADPDDFRLDRPHDETARHVAFGWGIHYCIGAALARLEARIAFEQILDRLGNIELDGEPVRNDSFVLHGLVRLPLRWTPLST